MILFFSITIIAIVPFIWSIHKTLSDDRLTDVILQTLILFCVVGHFLLFYNKYYYMQPDDIQTSLAHCATTAMVVPLIYMYTCRRFGALNMNNLAILLLLSLVAFIPCGIINIGFGSLPSDPTPEEMLQFNIYHNGLLLMHPMSYSLAVIFQSIFITYRIFILLHDMSNKNYKYSDHYKHFIVLVGVAILCIWISYLPDDEFWFGNLTCAGLVALFMILLGIGYVLTALKFDENPIIDENNEPVLMETPKRFTELAKNFEDLVNEEKIYLKNNILMEEVARMLKTNRTYVAQMIKQEYGTTFTALMNEKRIEVAMQLLSSDNENKTMQAIAAESGFNSLSSFNKTFKNLTGVVPSEWRLKRKG